MAERFLIVSFKFSKPSSDGRIDELEAIFNRGLDWLKFSARTWILYTRQTPDTWYARLTEVLESDEQVLVVEFDPATAQGRMKSWMWQWLNYDRETVKTVGDRLNEEKKQSITALNIFPDDESEESYE